MKHDNHKPAWRLLLDNEIAAAQHLNASTYVQLGTQDKHGLVQVRTMVWRGFTATSQDLLMATDIRSDKVVNMSSEQPRAQVVWYLSEARQQFRFTGELVCLGPRAENQLQRTAVWATLSSRARQSYFSNAFGELDKNAEQDAESDVPSPYFAVLKLSIAEVDHLCLRTQPHQRTKHYIQGGQWSESRIAL